MKNKPIENKQNCFNKHIAQLLQQNAKENTQYLAQEKD